MNTEYPWLFGEVTSMMPDTWYDRSYVRETKSQQYEPSLQPRPELERAHVASDIPSSA